MVVFYRNLPPAPTIDFTMKELIQFKKQRDLGEILGDTFKFIRLNWKLLFGLILKITGPALLVLLGTYILYARSLFGTMDFVDGLATWNSMGSSAVFSIVLMIVAALVYYALLNGVIMHFIKSYINNNGVVDEEAVKLGVKEDFWNLMGISFWVGLIVGFGLALCFLPGIYLGVVLSTAYAVLIFEKRDVLDTVNYCFKLIKNEWWITFATFFVMFLLYYMIMMVFQIPQYIYVFARGFSMGQEISADPAAMVDWVYLTLTSIAMIFQYLLYSIIVLCTAFVYFNLNEKKNFTGTMEAIDSLGRTE